VEHICDRIAFLNQGRLVRSGSLKDFQSESDRVEIELRGLSLAEVSRLHPAAATAGVSSGSIRISVPAQEQRRVIEAVWQAGGEIVSLAPLRRRLEELFLEWSDAGEVEGSAAISRAEQAVEGERHSR
jgi:ABC-2 type transport system ATP-binding protein